jgi:large subunit ribosomal protein L25
MATANLNASPRNDTGKGVARKLRSAGQVPGVIYGHARDAQPLSVDARELGRLLEHVSASTVIELDLGGITTRTLIREIQRHPYKKQVLHVDFQELVAGEKVTVRVPIVYTGTAAGVREGGGVLDQILHELTVYADPTVIPEAITVDVTNITIGHSLHVSDLQLPPGVEALDEPDAAVAVVTAPKTQVETTTTETTTAAEPELIRKPKAEDAGA